MRRLWITRIRILQALLSVAVITGFALLAGVNPLEEWWYWTAATTVITVAVAEPYFTGPVPALLYAIGGIGAGVFATRTGVESLWILYFAIAGVVLAAAIVARAIPLGRVQDSARWFATRFGRPLWLGVSAVAIEFVRLSATQPTQTTALTVIGILIALVCCVPDWYRLVIASRSISGELVSVEAAVDPNLLLLSTRHRLKPGQALTVRGLSRSTGVVVGNLAHRAGNRVQVATARPWTEIVTSTGDEVEISLDESTGAIALGLVADGTTDRALVLRALGALSRGDTVYWEDQENKRYLYQVLGLELRQTTWDSATVLAEVATAGMLGVVDGVGITPESKLPHPFAPVWSATGVTAPLQAGFERIGTISGTAIPLGVAKSKLRSHHMAILGMSGMGKSTVSRRLLELLSSDGTVVALDGTGEYRTRFGITPWNATIGLSTDGKWVHEPAGVQARSAKDFIVDAMTAANAEYSVGTPRSRTILLEEAHSFLPEWNFTAARDESNFVAESCRYILQARKFGISFILVSQRTAVISKSALSQCESYIIFRTLDDTSLQYIEGVLGREFRDVATSLRRFQAICVGPAFSTSTPVVVDLDDVGGSV